MVVLKNSLSSSRGASRRFDSNMSEVGRKLGALVSGVTTDNVAIAQGDVISVDRDTLTIDVKLVSGHVLSGVTLDVVVGGGSGILVFPAVGSVVSLGFVEGRVEIPFVIGYTRVDAVEMVIGADGGDLTNVKIEDGVVEINGGALGGLVVSGDVAAKLNDLERDVNALKQVFAGWVPVANDGGAALKGAVGSWSGHQLALTMAEELENDKILQ